MSSTRKIVVTSGNEAFAPLLVDLIQSLQQFSGFDAIGVLDVGLSPQTRIQVQSYVTAIVEPEWDFPIDAPLRESKPYLRAHLARAFLRKYFPNYSIYLWLDADTWVQEQYALLWFIEAARNGTIGLVPESDRSYRHREGVRRWRRRNLISYFGEKAVSLSLSRPYFNAGAFSLHVDAPHWESWAAHFANGLKASPYLVTDQTALNYSLWSDDLPIHPLPALCNWCCHLAVPSVNADAKLCEPYVPYQRIGLVHLTAKTKDLRLNIKINGKTVTGSLRFRGIPLLQPAAA